MFEKLKTLTLKNTNPTDFDDEVVHTESSNNGEAIDADIILPDILFDISSKIESIGSEAQALSIADELHTTEALTYFELGGILCRIRNKKWFGEHVTFRELCEKRFGMCARNARYLINTHTWVIKANLTWPQIEDVAWSKMRLLPSNIDPSIAEEWIEKARLLTHIIHDGQAV